MPYILFIASVFISAIAQILLKKSADRIYTHKHKEYLNALVIGGYSLFLLCTLLSVIAYRDLGLKTGAILETLSYLFVLILGKLFLNEKVTLIKIIGNILIISGIIVFSV